MIKSILQKLLLSRTSQKEILADLKTHPNFKSKDAMTQQSLDATPARLPLEKGKIESILLPNFGNQSGLKVTQWRFKAGDLVKSVHIVCKIENQHITMEFESVFKGRIVSICRPNQPLIPGEEIFQIEGV